MKAQFKITAPAKKPVKKAATKAAPKKTKKDIAASYNSYKFFNGKQYTGMKVGRSIKWYYDKGVWIDKKLTPEKWTISFDVMKRRAGHAPEGSGAPVGTEYHWYILAHQVVKKLDANTYSTDMNGVKFKLSHKRSSKKEWNINDKTQRKHLIKILEAYLEELRQEPAEEADENQEPKAAKKTKVPAAKETAAKTSRRKKAELTEA